MDAVQVKTNPNSTIIISIDLSTTPWNELHPNNLSPFKVEEILCPCEIYPDGVFPGAQRYGPDKQISRIMRFKNYIEFSKVVPEDTRMINGERYLTSRFYEQRKIGWTSESFMTKPGQTIGYCLNGDVYNVEQKDKLYAIYYGVVYFSVAKKLKSFEDLQTMLSQGLTLELTGADHDILTQIGEVLLKKT